MYRGTSDGTPKRHTKPKKTNSDRAPDDREPAPNRIARDSLWPERAAIRFDATPRQIKKRSPQAATYILTQVRTYYYSRKIRRLQSVSGLILLNLQTLQVVRQKTNLWEISG